MKIYADTPALRSRQHAQDALVVVFSLLCIRAGTWVHALVEQLARPGVAIESAGDRFATTLGDVGGRVGDVPLAGDALEEPFLAASRAGIVLRDAGAAQQTAVHRIAFWLGLLVAALPIAYVGIRHLTRRWEWVRQAAAARELLAVAGDTRLFALRAMTTLPLHELARVTADPVGDLDRGEHDLLASYELQRLGLRLPGAGPFTPERVPVGAGPVR
jgi:hypothetical protein